MEVQFLIETENSGFWLPYSALQREASGLWSVFVLEAEGDRQIVGRRIVEMVQLEETHTLVRGALSAGDVFIEDGLNRIVPGQAVKGKLRTSDYQQSVAPGAGE